MEPKEGEKTRIYVGGLGEKVTNDDLIKIFSSLGVVKAVDIVRTKGRSFGYVDFYPSSDKSLSKLFSTYNGCVWKGGRLRLEKAKEHYLARLKREWAEDAQLARSTPSECVDADKDVATLENPKKVLNSAKDLHIFFPRLRKVKSLQFSGTGKHKYSFQRVEAPPLPVYFCDCEEHSVPSYTAEGKKIINHTTEVDKMSDLEAESGGMNEEELNMMNSVMNKLFERENVSNATCHGIGLANDEHNSIKLIEDLQFGKNEADSIEDEDNLIINAVSRGNNRMAFSSCQGKTTISPINQKSTFSETRNSKGRPARVPESQKENNLLPTKKRKSLFSEEHIRNEFVSGNPRDDMNLRTPLETQPTGTDSGVKQSTADRSWSQKLSWRALVGDKGSSVFNVSNIFPVVASTKEADNAVELIEDLQFDENETDEDNLIINVVSKKDSRKTLPGNQEQGAKSIVIQKPTVSETQTSEDRTVHTGLKEHKMSALPPKKKRKSLMNEESDRNKLVFTIPEGSGTLQTHRNESTNPARAKPIEQELVVKQSIANRSESQKSSRVELVGDKDKDGVSFSNILPDVAAKEDQPVSDGPNFPEEQPVSDGPNVPDFSDSENKIGKYDNSEGKSNEKEIVEVLEDQPTKTNEATNKSGRGSSWFQKSSWTQLVTENNNSFSITQISPGITFKKHEHTKPQGVLDTVKHNNMCSNLVKPDKSEPTRSGFTKVDNGKEGDVATNFPEKNQETLGNNEASASIVEKFFSGKNHLTVGNNEAYASIVENTYDSVQRESIGETCSFMKSASSLKEWAKTKAALSGSHKRKSNEK